MLHRDSQVPVGVSDHGGTDELFRDRALKS